MIQDSSQLLIHLDWLTISEVATTLEQFGMEYPFDYVRYLAFSVESPQSERRNSTIKDPKSLRMEFTRILLLPT